MDNYYGIEYFPGNTDIFDKMKRYVIKSNLIGNTKKNRSTPVIYKRN